MAIASQKELREQVDLYHRDFEKEKEEIFDIAADMTRQYKGMQEELLARINILENQITEQKGKKDAKKDAGETGELTPQELLRRAALRIESLERHAQGDA